MLPKVHLYFNSQLLHFTQLITGLELLHQKGKINLQYSIETSSYPIDLCRVSYKGKILIFDLADSSDIREDVYNECDFYVKRMLLREDFQKKERLVPYGLNYSVFLENHFMKSLIFKGNFLKYSMRYYPLISRILKIKNSIATTHLKLMQDKPIDDFRMTFRTRLWNPENNTTPWKKEERRQMNKDRIEINKVLKEQFGNCFDGGIERDSFSKEICPELLLSDKDYHKKNYLKKLKASSVGIITEGLERSIGWKFGEYVAHSIAILTHPIDEFQLLGDFRKGTNYLTYANKEELIAQVNHLLNDKDFRMKIQRSNYDYYQQYLEPSAKLKRIFELVDRSGD